LEGAERRRRSPVTNKLKQKKKGFFLVRTGPFMLQKKAAFSRMSTPEKKSIFEEFSGPPVKTKRNPPGDVEAKNLTLLGTDKKTCAHASGTKGGVSPLRKKKPIDQNEATNPQTGAANSLCGAFKQKKKKKNNVSSCAIETTVG